MNKKTIKAGVLKGIFAFGLLCAATIPHLAFGQVPASTVKMIPKILGKVFNEDKTFLPNASVQVKGKPNISTSTNSQGEFIITPDTEITTLVFKSIGYQTKEVAITTEIKLPLIIILSKDSTDIEEVIVTGYGNRSKENFTGSASSFTKEELLRVGNKNVLQSLQNLDPSFVIAENLALGSNPNMLPDIQLRGQAGLDDVKGEYSGNPNLPLFILDGFEASLQKVYDLDMNRVASITILKDAAAKAIYGSKAANGVVVIETVLPQEGNIRVSYSGNFNIEAPDLTSYSLTNARQKLQVELNAGRYTSTQPYTQQFLTEEYNAVLKNVERGVDTYWLSQPLRVGLGNKHTLYLEGGTSEMRYGVDMTYNNVLGVMKGSNRENIGGSINLSYRKNKVLFRNILNITFNTSNNSPYGTFSEYAALNPYLSPYDDSGKLQKILGSFQTSASGDPLLYYNPLYNANLGTKNFSKYNEITENFYIEWQATKEFRLTGRVGYTFNGSSDENFLPGDHTSFANWTEDRYFLRGSYSINDANSNSLTSDLLANWTKQLGKHFFLVTGNFNLGTHSSNLHGMNAQGFLNNRVDFISFAKQYAENGIPRGTESITREIGFTTFGNYAYDNRYLLDLSIRRNASSVFGSNNRWGTFWSVGLGWNAHNELLLKNIKTINLFRFRGSIGSTGSQNFNPYQALATYNFFTSSTYDNISGAYLYALANDNLKWQETIDLNTGTDIKLFNKLNLRFDYYISRTNSLLIDFTLPPSTGFTSYKENLGSILNRGLEGSISYMLYSNPQKQSFISVSTAFSRNTNKLLKISNALKSFNDSQDASTDNLNSLRVRYVEGQSINSIWGVRSMGIDPITGRELFLKKDGTTTTYTYNTDDQIALGVSDPKLRGNLGANLEYKGWGLNAALRYTLLADYYNTTLINKVENVNIAYNVDTRVLTDTWLNPGDESYFKKITNVPTTTRPTSRFLQSKSDLSLSSINAYYDFKWKNLKKYHLQNLKLGLMMSEAFVVSNVQTERGTDYPFARTFSFTIQSTF